MDNALAPSMDNAVAGFRKKMFVFAGISCISPAKGVPIHGGVFSTEDGMLSSPPGVFL